MGKEIELLDETQKEKKKRTRPDRTVQAEPDEISEMMQNALVLYNLPEIDLNDNVQVAKRVGEYFQICEDRGMKPSLSGLALSLNVDRTTLYRWANGKTEGKPQDVCNTIKRAYRILNYAIEEYMQNGKINPVSGIFLMKNNFGYKDQSEVVLTPNNPLGEATDRSTLEQKYLDALPSGDAESAEVDLSETQKAAEEG